MFQYFHRYIEKLNLLVNGEDKMNEPIISIIVPVYNVENYLKRCIESILNQTFTDFELILVNDGSTDGSGIICKEFSSVDDRIKVINKNNGGLSSARNSGIEIARGKYISFIDSDDYINNNMFEILYREIIFSNSDISICNYCKVSDYNRPVDNNLQYKSQIFEGKENILNQLCDEKRMQFTVAWNKLYDKSLFNSIRFKEGKLHEDEFIAHEILDKANKVIYIESDLYYYYQREDSIMKKFNIDRLDFLDAIKERIEYFKKNNYMPLKEKTEKLYLEMFFCYYNIIKNEKSSKVLYELRKKIIKHKILLFKNNKILIKEKLLLLLFVINPSLYRKILN